MKRFTVSSLSLCLLMLSGVLRADTYHTAPDASAGGGIHGVITPTFTTTNASGFKKTETLQFQKIVAVEPYELKAYEGSLNTATGEFSFHGLPPGEYDLIVKTIGRVFEGATLEMEPGQATPADLKAITETVMSFYKDSEPYFNVKHIVRLAGDQEHVRFLTVNTRTKPVVDPSGAEIHADIRRIEFVDMVKANKVWIITTDRHVLRQEVPKGSDDIKIELTHLPKLGGILVGSKVRDLGTLKLDELEPGDPKKYTTITWREKGT